MRQGDILDKKPLYGWVTDSELEVPYGMFSIVPPPTESDSLTSIVDEAVAELPEIRLPKFYETEVKQTVSVPISYIQSASTNTMLNFIAQIKEEDRKSVVKTALSYLDDPLNRSSFGLYGEDKKIRAYFAAAIAECVGTMIDIESDKVLGIDDVSAPTSIVPPRAKVERDPDSGEFYVTGEVA